MTLGMCRDKHFAKRLPGPVDKRAWTRCASILTFCRHRITNGVAEGLNSKVMFIKRKACGFWNREHFKTAIDFF